MAQTSTTSRASRRRHVAKWTPNPQSTTDSNDRRWSDTLAKTLNTDRDVVGRRHRKWLKSARKLLDRRKMWFPTRLDLEKVRRVIEISGFKGQFRSVGTDSVQDALLTDAEKRELAGFSKDLERCATGTEMKRFPS